MIEPVHLYRYFGRDAYGIAAEINRQTRERIEADLAEQDRLRRLEEANDE